MTCIARPLGIFITVILAAMIATGMLSITLPVIAVAAMVLAGTALCVRIIVRTRRLRAASGRCTTCARQCQYALDGTEPEPRVFITDLKAGGRWPEAGNWSPAVRERTRL